MDNYPLVSKIVFCGTLTEIKDVSMISYKNKMHLKQPQKTRTKRVDTRLANKPIYRKNEKVTAAATQRGNIVCSERARSDLVEYLGWQVEMGVPVVLSEDGRYELKLKLSGRFNFLVKYALILCTLLVMLFTSLPSTQYAFFITNN